MKRGARGVGRGRAGAAAGSSSRPAADVGEGSRATPTPSTTAAPARTPSTSSRTTRGPASGPGRFRPKNVRRDEAERDTIARQEEKKATDRAAEEKRARGRSRFRSKRSRGDAMGARGGSRLTAGPQGPLSSGYAGPTSRGGGGLFGGGGGGGGGGGFGGGSRAKGGRGLPGFGDAGDGRHRETRINADKLHGKEPEGELDSDDEAMMTALGLRNNVLPMGIYRREHKETGVVVATTAELEAAENAGEEESLWVDGDSPSVEPVPEQPAEEGVWQTGDDKPVVVKDEPDTDATMDIDTPTPAEQPVEGKEGKPKVEVRVKKKTAPQDPEEQVIQSDLSMLASELGAVTVTEEDGKTRADGPVDKEGRLYLFQFPPLLPPLRPVQEQQPPVQVKAEPGDSDMQDAPAAAAAPASGGTPIDLTEGAAGTEADQDDDEDDDRRGFEPSLLGEGGMVGKLNVRKSGKVELDWGGRILELSPATAMNFLTTAVIVEENDQKPTPGVIGGDGIGMGKIMGRFTLAPVWGDEGDWDVAPDEVAVEEQRAEP